MSGNALLPENFPVDSEKVSLGLVLMGEMQILNCTVEPVCLSR